MSSSTKGGTKKCRNSNKNKGDCAEYLVKKYYENKGYKALDTDTLKSGSGHGIDHVFFKGNEVVCVETKNKDVNLSKLQIAGGKIYVRDCIEYMWWGYERSEDPKEKRDAEEGKDLGKKKDRRKMNSWKRSYGVEEDEYGNRKFLNALGYLQSKIKNAEKVTYTVCRVWVDESDDTGCYGQDSPEDNKPNAGFCKLDDARKDDNLVFCEWGDGKIEKKGEI